MTVWESTLQRHIPDESIWGPIAAVIGISTSLWLAFALFVASILALLAVPDIRHLSADTEPTPSSGALSGMQPP